MMTGSVNDWDEETFQSLYGRWSPLTPDGVARLLAGAGVRWWIVGGRAARPPWSRGAHRWLVATLTLLGHQEWARLVASRQPSG